jgi:hypothetical protein
MVKPSPIIPEKTKPNTLYGLLRVIYIKKKNKKPV